MVSRSVRRDSLPGQMVSVPPCFLLRQPCDSLARVRTDSGEECWGSVWGKVRYLGPQSVKSIMVLSLSVF